MDTKKVTFLSFLKSFFSVLTWVSSSTKRIRAEHRTARNPQPEPLLKVMELTLIHLGSDIGPNEDLLIRLRRFLERKAVAPESFSKPHVKEWLNKSETQSKLMSLSANKIIHRPRDEESYDVLVRSYMEISGEGFQFAVDIIETAITTIVSGVTAGINDPQLNKVISIQFDGLHKRLDNVDKSLFPELQWSISKICEANERWLNETFSARNQAKTRLGQPLCPGAPGHVLDRSELKGKLLNILSSLRSDQVIVVSGAEGNGKSWLVAQTWLSMLEKPLTVFISAEDIQDPLTDMSTILAKALNKSLPSHLRPKIDICQKILDLWRDIQNRPDVGFLVILDGINQRPEGKWAKIIDLLNEALQEIGGKLIITSREYYFNTVVKPQLVAEVQQLVVSEWSVTERNQILGNNGISADTLNIRVADSLKNPRLLGIALTLIGHEQLQVMEELSVSLLLFEHIRSSQRDTYDNSASEFSRKLQNHGQEVFERLSTQQRDDLAVFDGGLNAVVDGHFFTPLTEDASRYRICDDGLSLALGLAILDSLNKAIRNNKDSEETMAVLSEPIAALDKTAEAIFAALTVACIQNNHPDEAGVAILVSFSQLLNPDNDNFGAFAALARIRPTVFLTAYEKMAIRDMSGVNSDWLELALLRSKFDSVAQDVILNSVSKWLAFFSQKNKISSDETEQVDISEFVNYSQLEKVLLASLQDFPDGNISNLSLMAFRLLAGLPLANLVPELVKWRFSCCISGDYRAPTSEFRDLICFNTVDWAATRHELLTLAMPLITEDNSFKGQWTAVALLLATGHPDDARHAMNTVSRLRKDDEPHYSWHINESFCKTDPCCPSNVEPDNVAETAKTYSLINVKDVFSTYGMNQAQLIFDTARTGLCRYYSDIAVTMHRSVIDELLYREGIPLRQAICGLQQHCMLVTSAQAHKLAFRVVSTDDLDKAAWSSLKDEETIFKQLQLILSFEQLNASTQFMVLKKFGHSESLLLDLVRLIKPLDSSEFESILGQAILEQDMQLLRITLFFTPYTDGQLSDVVLSHLNYLLCSESEWVRVLTLRLISRSGSPAALKIVVERLLETGSILIEEYGRWDQSEVCYQAIMEGITSWQQVKSYLVLAHIGKLSYACSEDFGQWLAMYLDNLLTNAFNVSRITDNIQVVQRINPHRQFDRDSLYLSHMEPEEKTLEQYLENMKNNRENFRARQNKLRDALNCIQGELKKSCAENIINCFRSNDFKVACQADPDFISRWVQRFLEKNDEELHLVTNAGFALAQAISDSQPKLAVKLFDKLKNTKGINKIFYSSAGIELNRFSIWAAADNDEIDDLRVRRLLKAVNNDALAKEVWAALLADKERFILQFIEKMLCSEKPSEQARGILITGYLNIGNFPETVFSRFDGEQGLLGDTLKIARESMRRYQWAIHWFQIMLKASQPVEYWCASILFLQVVDGRFDALGLTRRKGSVIFELYWPITEKKLKERFDKQSKKRSESLLAGKTPLLCFIGQ